MIDHIIQSGSGNQFIFTPDYEFKDSSKKIQNEHRTRAGVLYSYKWAEFKKFSIPVSFVDIVLKNVLNDWWSENRNLSYFQIESGEQITDVTTVRMVNKSKPINKSIKPYNDLYAGVIELEQTNG